MKLDPDQLGSVVNRLRRAQGQLAAVTRAVEQGHDCEATIVQLAAVSRALDKAGFAIIATSMRQCVMEGEAAAAEGREPAETIDVAKLEKLFLSLA